MPVLMESSLGGLRLAHRGKVRDTYDLGEHLLIIASDRISAFDVVMANGIPDKGRILTRMSNFWFGELGAVCPNHLVETSDEGIRARVDGWTPDLAGRAVVVRKARPLTIECVARQYIAGSLFKEYRAEGGKIHGLDLPPGLADGDRLPEVIFTPATKATSGHDENISFAEAANRAGTEVAELARKWTLALFAKAVEHAASAGLILADTKFEFGLTEDGLVWIDEALTPDSSRYWEASLWKPGGAQPSFDKQFVRDYLESIGWDKRPPGPTLPAEVVEKTRAKYLECYRRVTGGELA
ncbi:MAG: phosphoribosylaminoimidazolesuccinocarboxamide synthase [Armatimonadetes bacterium]|nr:phosphoribosylaminoimidazolesuccinocarboxamide synthase [Armatimonadota bacterium]